jgi:hypothetical protein
MQLYDSGAVRGFCRISLREMRRGLRRRWGWGDARMRLVGVFVTFFFRDGSLGIDGVANEHLIVCDSWRRGTDFRKGVRYNGCGGGGEWVEAVG